MLLCVIRLGDLFALSIMYFTIPNEIWSPKPQHSITTIINCSLVAIDTVNFLGISIVGQTNEDGSGGGIYVGSVMKG